MAPSGTMFSMVGYGIAIPLDVITSFQHLQPAPASCNSKTFVNNLILDGVSARLETEKNDGSGMPMIWPFIHYVCVLNALYQCQFSQQMQMDYTQYSIAMHSASKARAD